MFKLADNGDLEAILKFSLELKSQKARMSFTDFDTENMVLDQLDDPLVSLYIVFEKDQVIAMFRGVRGEGNKGHSVYVACAVKKQYRNQNLATDITHFALEDLKSKGVLIARTKIYSWNDASIATIKKCGFEASGKIVMHEYMEEIKAYIDDLIFHKIL
jgi:RimJ/RimL family protein N-acetyltransferase